MSLAWFLVLLVSSATVCRAEEETEAQQLFQQAETAFENEDYGTAARLFQRADKLAPHPSVIFNAAVSWDYSGELARAANAYQTALGRDGLSAEQTEQAELRLGQLRERLGYVLIGKPVGGVISVADLEREPIPARFYLAPGVYTALVEPVSGAATETTVSVEAGQTLRIEFKQTAAPPSPTPAPPPPVQPRPPADSPPNQSSTWRTLGWVGIGLSVAATGTAVYLGLEALAARDRFENDRTNAAARSDAVQFQRGTNIAWGTAAVTGGLGTVLLLTSPRVEF